MNDFDPARSDPVAAIALLYDREAIKELRAIYAWHAARGDYERLAELYTEDGVFEVSWEGEHHVSRGRDAIREHLRSRLKPGMVAPTTHNHIITIVGDEAFGTSMMMMAGGTGVSGRYHDHLRKAKGDGRWRFVERHFACYTPEFEDIGLGYFGKLTD